MRKHFATALAASLSLALPALAAEPGASAPAERKAAKKEGTAAKTDRAAPARAKPADGAAGGKGAPAAEPGGAAPEAPKGAEKPCEPVKPCPIDG